LVELILLNLWVTHDITSFSDDIVPNGMINNNEQEGMSKEAVMAQLKILSWYLSSGNEEKYKKLQLGQHKSQPTSRKIRAEPTF
jgi:hypothetical protein